MKEKMEEVHTCCAEIHVIRVYLLSQSASEKQSRKRPTNLCAPTEFLDPFTCSRCVICISCSVHLILMYYVRKGSWAFLSLIPTSQRSANTITNTSFALFYFKGSAQVWLLKFQSFYCLILSQRPFLKHGFKKRTRTHTQNEKNCLVFVG